MDLRRIAPGARTEIGRWSATALLGLTAVIAGEALVSPICYWQGAQRTQPGGLSAAAYDPAIAPYHLLALGLFAAWAVCWFLHLRRVRREGANLLYAFAPMALFVAAALRASVMSYACNPL